MNIRPEHEPQQDIPEADALEQQTPILPESSGEYAEPLPDDAPEADVMEQRADVLPGQTGFAGIAGAAEADASEADLIEQAVAPSADDEEDYPEVSEEAD